MKKITESTKQLSIVRAVTGIILSIVILVIAQILSLSISEILFNFGIPIAICNSIAGVLYVTLTLIGVNVLCGRVLKVSMREMRIPRFKVKSVWMLVALFMPIMVLMFFMITGGYWEIHRFDTETTLSTVTSAVLFYGLATGIVEEVIFRGVIMGCLEKQFNIQIGIIIPSVLFGALHIIGSSLDFISTVQLVIAGSIVGILFSLIAYESHSVWNNAIVHGIWNMVMIGGILHIGTSADSNAMFNFVLRNKMFLLSGGDFGIEASVISIFTYFVFCILAVVLIKKRKKSY
ncbi:MAG TPA: CPBP family intramembrane metalloprotease [Candidatus Merdenecus merdavium]|nr:CPBP family intramembrane metalloprotease [Candidatus Merdenecus merdavium]